MPGRDADGQLPVSKGRINKRIRIKLDEGP
jgi:hypothetical protein